MKQRTPSRDRKIVPIAEAAERRREKVVRENLQELADAAEGLADEPEAASNFTMVGNMALIEQAFEEAIEPFSRALSLAPDDVSARAGRARAYAALGEHGLALADFERAAALAPDEPMHHVGRANALAHLGRMTEAVTACSRAIEVAPDHAGAPTPAPCTEVTSTRTIPECGPISIAPSSWRPTRRPTSRREPST